jgi:hypothetical protein
LGNTTLYTHTILYKTTFFYPTPYPPPYSFLKLFSFFVLVVGFLISHRSGLGVKPLGVLYFLSHSQSFDSQPYPLVIIKQTITIGLASSMNMVKCQALNRSDSWWFLTTLPIRTRFASLALPSLRNVLCVSQHKFCLPQNTLTLLLDSRRYIHFVHFCEGTSARLGVLPLNIYIQVWHSPITIINTTVTVHLYSVLSYIFYM